MRAGLALPHNLANTPRSPQMAGLALHPHPGVSTGKSTVCTSSRTALDLEQSVPGQCPLTNYLKLGACLMTAHPPRLLLVLRAHPPGPCLTAATPIRPWAAGGYRSSEGDLEEARRSLIAKRQTTTRFSYEGGDWVMRARRIGLSDADLDTCRLSYEPEDQSV